MTSGENPAEGMWKRGPRFAWKVLHETVFVLGAIAVIAAATVWLGQQWHHHEWRPVEARKVESLRSTLLIAKVREGFGEPSARERYKRGISAEYFHRHDYWLQVLFRRSSGSVIGWVITGCRGDFRPSFKFGDEQVKLWSSSAAEVETATAVLDTSLTYWRASTIHQPNRLLAFGTGPGVFSFVGVVWGVSDVCGVEFNQPAQIIAKAAPRTFDRYDGPAAACRRCTKIASAIRINTYGEIYSAEVDSGPTVGWLQRNVGLGTPASIAAGPLPFESEVTHQ